MDTTRTYQIAGMDCANCAREVEEGVRRLKGVETASVDYMTCKLTVTGTASFEDMQARVKALGKTLIPPDAKRISRRAPVQATANAISLDAIPVAAAPHIHTDDDGHDHSDDGHAHDHDHGDDVTVSRGGVLGFFEYLTKRDDTRAALTGAALVIVALVLSIFTDAPLVDGLIIAGMVVAGLPIAISGVNTLRINRRFNINMLMSIAAIGAVIISEYLEGAVVVVLFAIGEALEGYTANRARDSITSLLSLKPARALKVTSSGDIEINADELVIGDIVIVKPGDAIPADGTITQGASGINQAPVTGESVPVYKTVGDGVYAGTLNGDGLLRVQVTSAAEDNTISRIIKLVEEAQSVRAPSQRMIDQFAAWYTPAVAVLALLVAFIPPLLFNQPFYDTPETHGWLYRALSLLVIACPCALVISTPVTVISAMAAAARRGVLIKGGAFLEALGTLKAVAVDKTGTLTSGKLRVTQIQGAEERHAEDILALAAALERQSTHPLARAVVEAAKAQQIDERYPAAEHVELIPGRGLRGEVDGRSVTIGSHSYFEAEFPHAQGLCDWAKAQEATGHSTMMLADGATVLGALALADTLRDETPALVATMHTAGVEVVMLTGDHQAAAETFATQAGVRHVRAGLLPEQKVDALRDLQTAFGAVAMVGDGVNDAPALAAATIGIAMGGAGSPQALETADVALMADDLSGLTFAVRLSKFARSLIRQNVVLSFGLKALFVVLALEGAASLWLAVAADVGMSLVVTLNGMRPLRMTDNT